ncbi:zinc finger RNA-binding protein 2 isoform X1 [Lutzomyia longipalpis]|uniref:zinc finger RNA-binding protein 2 isoform X1 n=1 Tax=Lutzomyia longipalpis TaxID=7200 RepID=UPI0024839A17|nr:zinc finger RNA-binding protein 2 isoform X1 [Lutzomyia longipalpis]
MATNNYFGFTHGGTQYGTAATGAAYPVTQAGYMPATVTYNAQRPAGYETYQAPTTQGTYASTGTATPTYDYGYGRPAQSYDTSKTYYQQAGATTAYSGQAYDSSTTAKVAGYQTTTYAQPARAAAQPAKVTQYVTQPTYTQATTTTNSTTKQSTATTNATTYSNIDAALYSAAATMYVAQKSNKTTTPGQGNSWQYKKPGVGGANKQRFKQPPKPQQLHYCEVCKISCAGPQTYREHLDGQKHKKREASLKLSATAANMAQNRGNSLHCELCDVTCTGFDAYAAHVRGSKHQKVVKLHQKLGKPIPSTDPLTKKPAKVNFVPAGTVEKEGGEAVAPGTTGTESQEEESTIHMPVDDVKPVGVEYIEEIKDDDGKILSFNCKLCECKFNDPNAKEMHMKGRRHRLQYKKKVQPDLVVDIKPSPRRQKIAEAKAQRAAMQEEYWNRRRMADADLEDDERIYWEERRRFEEEFDYMNWMQRGFPGVGPRGPHMGRGGPPIGHPFFGGIMSGRRPESSDDRHVVARHAEIYPKEEELQTIQRIVSHTERALKYVSDALADTGKGTNAKAGDGAQQKANVDCKNEPSKKEDGRDNQMFSFQKDAEGSVRVLKGVMRVGLLAKGLLLQGDTLVQLVVLCAEKPTTLLLKKVANELPVQLKKVYEEHSYTVTMAPVEGAVLVSDGQITVKVSLTSPLLREPDMNNATATEQPVQNTEDLLPREPCLQALAALRHAKWFQARATGLQSCVMVMRVLRDLCQRTPMWSPLSQWAMELFTEKVISSASIPLSPGDCIRRVMEAAASGLFINGPGIMDPCEKEPHDAFSGLSKQQREDLTSSAQTFLRYVAFRQIHKVLGMDPLPQPKFVPRQWRFNRKRRRSGTDGAENEGDQVSSTDGKMVKKDEGVVGDKMDSESMK